jgi:hypothetical protein
MPQRKRSAVLHFGLLGPYRCKGFTVRSRSRARNRLALLQRETDPFCLSYKQTPARTNWVSFKALLHKRQSNYTVDKPERDSRSDVPTPKLTNRDPLGSDHRSQDRIERHSTARLSFRIRGVFVLKCAFACAYSRRVSGTFSFDFLLSPDAGCFKRRSVQGIARLYFGRRSRSGLSEHPLPMFHPFYQIK